LVFVGQVALAQLETVADLNFGTGYIQPGQAQVTQRVALVDLDDNNDKITITKVEVENVLGTAVPTDFALVEILDSNDIVRGSVSFPTSYPIIITITGWTIPDDSSDTLQVRVTVAPGVIGHRTIQTRVSISYKEGHKSCVATVDDGNATIINNPPVAADNAYSVNEDNTLTVAAPGVLGNDSDPDGDTLTAVLVSGPSHAAYFTLNEDGSFTYTPAENFFGTDYFTYQAYDGVDYSNVATVTITVSSVNDAPVAEDDSYTTDEDTPLVVPAPGVLGNDSDVEGDPLTAVLVSGPSHGTLTLNPNGSFTYTPAENFFGTDYFTYQAYDGVDYSNVATVTITVSSVNDAPVAEDDSYTTDEDTPLVVPAPGVLGNDSDVEGDPLTAVLVSGPSHGTLTLNPNGSFTYTPEENFVGEDSFTYKAYDGELYSNVATVTITVSSVQHTGSLKVTIQPPEAVTAGAQWKATRNGYDSGWKNSGDTLTNLPVGQYTVTFKDIPGWTKPADQTVTITKDTTTEVTGTYTIIAVFYEDFEDISGWIRTGLWHTCSDACSWGCQAKLIGKYAHYAKPGTCSYDTGTTTSGTLTSPIISIPKNTTLTLQFDYARYVENYTRDSRDLTYVQIRLGTDRTWGSWRTIWSRSSRNSSPECGTFTYTFQTRRDTRLQVRFIFNSVDRYNNNFPGWAIDNLIVRVPETAPAALEVTDIGDDVDNIVPETITVYNYPNPVKDVHTTTFVVEGVDAELIRVEIYDLTGKLVWQGEGSGNELTWHTEDLTGLPLANGVYLYKVFVKVGETWIASDVRKLVILR
jgi:VCBS repeat-containing protein